MINPLNIRLYRKDEKVKLTKIKGEFGSAGFSSERFTMENYDLYKNLDLDEIMVEINLKLLDVIEDGGAIGKKLNKMDDIRVDTKQYATSFRISYPYELYRKKDKDLIEFYHSIVTEVLNSL